MKDSKYDIKPIGAKETHCPKKVAFCKNHLSSELKAGSHISESWDPTCPIFESRICTGKSFRN